MSKAAQGELCLLFSLRQAGSKAPNGTRPFRVTIGNPLHEIEEINRLTDEMHAGLYPMLGLPAQAFRTTVEGERSESGLRKIGPVMPMVGHAHRTALGYVATICGAARVRA